MTTERVTFAATATATGRTLSGIAHAFGTRTLMGNRWFEFDRHSFDAALARGDVRAFVGHNTEMLLGRQSNGTVRASAEDDGLHYGIDVPDTSYGNDLLTLVARGDLNEMSFGVIPGKYTLSKAQDGRTVQLHTAVDELFDISPVSMPAFGGTSIALHSRSIEGESFASQLIRARARAIQGVPT